MTPATQPEAALSADSEDAEPVEDDEEVAAEPRPRPGRSREGLPAAYRMRHASHYVEHLMGDTPLQTVRQISIDQIDRGDAADGDADDVAALAASIRQVGILQPLLVTQGGSARFDLLAGGKRLAAAQEAGLQAVPCLVLHADQARAAELRTQAAVVAGRRESEPAPQTDAEPVAAPSASAVEESPAGPVGPVPLENALTATVGEIGGALDFVAALMPAAAAARTPFQQAVIADVIAVEQRRAAALSAAAAFLSDPSPLRPEEFDWLSFSADLRAAIDLEARLRSIDVEWLQSLALRPAMADRKAVMAGWSAILHAILGAATAGDRIGISLATPRLRPAIILTASLHSGPRFTPADESVEGAGMFADGAGELLLASARCSARRQGGRVSVSTTADALRIEFVAPQPLAWWH